MVDQLILEEILPEEWVAVFWKAFDEKVSQGADRVNLTRGAKTGAQLLTPEEAKEPLSRRLASQWAAHPEALKQLKESFEEKSKKW